jgi:hypothetical protein
MTVAVNINGPDARIILCEKTHSEMPASLQIEIEGVPITYPLHEDYSLAGARCWFFQSCSLVFSELNTQAVSRRVLLFTTNEILVTATRKAQPHF